MAQHVAQHVAQMLSRARRVPLCLTVHLVASIVASAASPPHIVHIMADDTGVRLIPSVRIELIESQILFQRVLGTAVCLNRAATDQLVSAC
eukprot:SAG31_NODE_5781_length_2331_cov_1.138889_4_plen_91_part_00